MQVGTAGPQGLEQHQGKKKCLATIEQRRKDEQKGKNLTLFSFLRRQDKREPTAVEVAREAERQEATSSSRIVVGPSSATPQLENFKIRDERPVEGNRDNGRAGKAGERSMDKTSGSRKRRKGCPDGWLLLDRLQAAIGNIPCNIPEGKQGDELASFNRNAGLMACAGIPLNELWENLNPSLDRLLGFRRPMNEIQAIIRRGPMGVEGFVEYLQVLVEEGGVVGSLIEGKVSTLVDAIIE